MRDRGALRAPYVKNGKGSRCARSRRAARAMRVDGNDEVGPPLPPPGCYPGLSAPRRVAAPSPRHHKRLDVLTIFADAPYQRPT